MTGFEPLIGAATTGLTGLIGNVVKEKNGDSRKKQDIDLFQGRTFNQAVQKYVKRYADRHGTLKVACVRMDSPVKLDEIYTAVQLLPRSALRYYESTQSLEELFRESGKRDFNFEDAEKKQGIEVANEQQYLMVLGGPGVGKSTFLRKMGLEALRRQAIMNSARQNSDVLKPQETYYAHDCIPVMLELRQFSSKNLSIKDVIAQEFDACGFPQAQKFTELFLQSGKLLVLLDGLDEVPNEVLDHAITDIENLVDRYNGNRFIVSCRVAAYTFGGFKRFNDVAMAAFEDSQIERFIKNWFKKPRDLEMDTTKRCWELLSSPDYQAAKELAQTPLLLTLLCIIYDEFQSFPKKRHQVYGEALDVLLRKWAAEKRIQRNPIYQELSPELELDLLSEIARDNFVQDQLFFQKQKVTDDIREFLITNLNAPDYLDAEQVLREIEIQQGILVERAQDIYSFSHLTFHEYLTAKWIVDNLSIGLEQQKDALTPDQNLLEKIVARFFPFQKSLANPASNLNETLDINPNISQFVSNYLLDRRWKEIFLLSAGLMPGRKGADDLLLAMERTAQSFLIGSARLRALVMWADSETQDAEDTSKTAAAKRTAALALALDFDLNRDLDLASDLASDLALNLDFNLARDRVRDRVLARTLALARDRDPEPDPDPDRVLGLEFERALDLDLDLDLYLALALNLAYEYQRFDIFQTEKVIRLIQNLDALKHQKPTGKISPKIYKDFSDLIQKTWEDLINFKQDYLDFSKQEIDAISNYFYTIELMVRCKEAAVRVSPTVWEGIESRILTVPDDTA